jgi:hypothetical protein
VNRFTHMEFQCTERRVGILSQPLCQLLPSFPYVGATVVLLGIKNTMPVRNQAFSVVHREGGSSRPTPRRPPPADRGMTERPGAGVLPHHAMGGHGLKKLR